MTSTKMLCKNCGNAITQDSLDKDDSESLEEQTCLKCIMLLQKESSKTNVCEIDISEGNNFSQISTLSTPDTTPNKTELPIDVDIEDSESHSSKNTSKNNQSKLIQPKLESSGKEQNSGVKYDITNVANAKHLYIDDNQFLDLLQDHGSPWPKTKHGRKKDEYNLRPRNCFYNLNSKPSRDNIGKDSKVYYNLYLLAGLLYDRFKDNSEIFVSFKKKESDNRMIRMRRIKKNC